MTKDKKLEISNTLFRLLFKDDKQEKFPIDIRQFTKTLEKWYKAHNSHAYQKLYQLGMTHKQLAICLLITNTIIIWPLAYFANAYRSLEFAMIILSYFMIGAIWLVVQLKYNESKEILS